MSEEVDQGVPSGGHSDDVAAVGRRTPAAPLPFSFETILAIADSLPVMVAYCDRDQVYRFCNRPIADWFERSRHEILGRTLRDVMGEEAYAIRQPSIEAALAGERQWFAASFEHPTRGPLTTQAEYIPQFGADGEVAGLIMVVQNVTEQRAAEASLRESEARFRRIANSAPAPMWVTAADGKRDFVNDAYRAFFDFPPEQVGQHDWQLALHPEDRDAFIADYRSGIGGGETFELLGRLRRADGAWRWMRTVSKPRKDLDGRTVGFIGVASDVTVAKEAEIELRRLVEERTSELSASEGRFRAIFDSVSTTIVLLAVDGTVIDVNRGAAPWRVGGAADAIGCLLWEVPTMDRFPEHRDLLRQMVAQVAHGDSVDRSITLARAGEAPVHLDMTMLPVRSVGGEIDYLLLEVRNVTELKAAQDQLRQSQKMEALGQLTGGIAHDFNNLLTVVVGGLDLISKQVTDQRLQRYAKNALSAAERGARLTGQLLAFSRVQRLEVQATYVAPLIEGMRPILRNVLGPGIAKRLDLDAERMPVMADPTQLEVAVLNLAINARDAMPTGGTLTIATRKVDIDDDGELEPGQYIELTIADTGAGMPPEVAARAFEPFFTTKEVGKGTGLGLSMVYGMARQSGGTARIESREGGGTAVRLYFRRADGPGAGRRRRARSGKSEGTPDRRYSVLVIDDDPDVRAFIVSSLEEEGYAVTEAANGEAGLDAFAHSRPDVVVLDYVMPGLTGADVAGRMIAAAPGQRILFVSGYSETDAIRSAAPDAALLVKPFRPEALDQAIRQLIARSNAHAG